MVDLYAHWPPLGREGGGNKLCSLLYSSISYDTQKGTRQFMSITDLHDTMTLLSDKSMFHAALNDYRNNAVSAFNVGSQLTRRRTLSTDHNITHSGCTVNKRVIFDKRLAVLSPEGSLSYQKRWWREAITKYRTVLEGKRLSFSPDPISIGID